MINVLKIGLLAIITTSCINASLNSNVDIKNRKEDLRSIYKNDPKIFHNVKINRFIEFAGYVRYYSECDTLNYSEYIEYLYEKIIFVDSIKVFNKLNRLFQNALSENYSIPLKNEDGSYDFAFNYILVFEEFYEGDGMSPLSLASSNIACSETENIFSNDGAAVMGFRTSGAFSYNKQKIDDYEDKNKGVLFNEICLEDIYYYMKDEDLNDVIYINQIKNSDFKIWYKIMKYYFNSLKNDKDFQAKREHNKRSMERRGKQF